MLIFFLMISILGACASYINMDPMKSSFYLILSMLMLMPMVSFGVNIWFSYFISLLFLSGIFVILVYFSSLSSFSKTKVFFVFVSLVVTLIAINNFSVVNLNMFLSLSVFYYKIYWFTLCYIVLVLLLFMNFTSYFLNFSGALRKI
uniref:NADH dehydrogenase subunit 6 n=1 Tax=Teladorsagia circumcincta TaxID=45464 RepID=D3J8A6_TELCI|nr:NADH dehydrogenase subunit 6 [Teladorsagia circumcincta]ACX85205.1 NADH dehydrogenase subunit 6 [Teladorsagia circumcincta]